MFQKGKDLLTKAEDAADSIHHNLKVFLPTISRLLLVSTFIDDGFRMIFQWRQQKDYMNTIWDCGKVLGILFVIVNMVAQLAGVFMVLKRMKIPVAVGILSGVILLQAVAYKSIFSWYDIFSHTFCVNLALLGGLVLVLAASYQETSSISPGLPELEDGHKPREYLMLAGRILLPFMFLTSMKFRFHWYHTIIDVIGGILILFVLFGFKTKLSALVLALGLFIFNFIENPFWLGDHPSVRDIIKYDFFLALSVIGGLLLIVEMGPGGVSWDERKKNK